MKQHKLHDFVLGMVIMALLVALAVPALAVTGRKQMVVDNTDIHLHVDGIPVSVSPFASGGTTYLPVRAVGEALGMDVRWDGPTHTVYITDPDPAASDTATTNNGSGITPSGKKTIEVDYVDIKLVVNGKEVTPKDVNGNVVEPFAYQGTTYLPVRAVGEALGKTVRWEGEAKTVHLGELPQATYLVDVCKVAKNNADAFDVYRAADHRAFAFDGKRYSQGFNGDTLSYDNAVTFELGGKYESLTFDFLNGDVKKSQSYHTVDRNLYVYLDGELSETIEGIEGGGAQTVTVPLNYAQTISFQPKTSILVDTPEMYVANAVLNGERTVTKPVPPANATYLADVYADQYGLDEYRAADGKYWEDMFGNKYTNGVYGSPTVQLNGRYKTLKATIIKSNYTGLYSYYDTLGKEAVTFSVDGETVKEIELSAATGPQTIEIPLNYGMELKFQGAGVFVADAILE